MLSLEADLIEGRVFPLTTEAEKWSMPSGIQVGWTGGEAIKHLGQVPSGAEPTAAAFRVDLCQSDPDAKDYWSAVIGSGPNKHVERIRLETLPLEFAMPKVE